MSGINDPIDQVVFLSQLEQRGSAREVYATTLDGRSYGLLQKQNQAYRNGDHYVVYLPGKRDGVPLAFSEEKSKAFKLADLLASVQAELTKADQDATAACGTPVKTNVDWATIDDEKLQSLSIGSFCGVVASELESMCRNTPAFKSTAPGLGLVQCKFAPQLKIRVENQQVLFSTEKDAPNQEEFVRQFLRNI